MYINNTPEVIIYTFSVIYVLFFYRFYFFFHSSISRRTEKTREYFTISKLLLLYLGRNNNIIKHFSEIHVYMLYIINNNEFKKND